MRPKILVIGYGAIGQPLVANLLEDGRFDLALWSVEPIANAGVFSVVDSLEAAFNFAPDLVVECAGHEVVRTLVPTLLARGFSTIIASVGALADTKLFNAIRLAASDGAAVIIPSGAIGGADYLSAVRDDPSLEVEYISRKPVQVWESELTSRGISAASLTSAFTIFSGSALEAALAYPKNLNVAATLALNSIGMEQTRVTILADPSVALNTHEIRIRGESGAAYFRFENLASASNPNTSALTQKSLFWEVKRFFRDLERLHKTSFNRSLK